MKQQHMLEKKKILKLQQNEHSLKKKNKNQFSMHESDIQCYTTIFPGLFIILFRNKLQ